MLKGLLHIVVFVAMTLGALAVTLFLVGSLSRGEPTLPGEAKIVYDRGYLNEGIEKASPDGRYVATAVNNGTRSYIDSDFKTGVDILRVTKDGETLVELLHHGDFGSVWREFGEIRWSSEDSVSFGHRNGNEPLQSFELGLTLR